MLNETRAYDTLNFITRILSIDDAPTNYFIKYYLDQDGNLIQEWNETNHSKWSIEERDLGHVFKVNSSQGRIEKEVDTMANRHVYYSYNDNGKLVLKEICNGNNRHECIKWVYDYDPSSELKKLPC